MLNSINYRPDVLPGDIAGRIKPQNITEAAEQFEAMFMRSMMQQMRKASEALIADDNPFSSKHQRMMQDFYDDKMASQLASRHAAGIAEMIIQQLSPQGGAAFKKDAPRADLPQVPKELTTPVIPVMRTGQEW